MKNLGLILTLIMMMSASAKAQTPAPTAIQVIPTCDNNESVVPCLFPEEDTKDAVIEMILANTEGYALLTKTADAGMELGLFSPEKSVMKITVEKSIDSNSMPMHFESTIKYDILLTDCRGTDACGASYLWTVIETSVGDGYSTDTQYTNTLTKVTSQNW